MLSWRTSNPTPSAHKHLSKAADPPSKKPKVIVELDTLENLPTDVRQFYSDNWYTIQSSVGGPKFSTFIFYNPPTEDYSPDFKALLMPVFEKRSTCFKVNFSYHLVLRHSETNTLRFFQASINNACVLELQFKSITNQTSTNSSRQCTRVILLILKTTLVIKTNIFFPNY